MSKMSKSTRQQSSARPSDADLLRAAQKGAGRSQVRFAVDVLGVNDRTFRGWIKRTDPEPAWSPVVRLAWLVSRHPELADELEGEFRA